MKVDYTYKLNRDFLNRRIGELGLKHAVISRKMGVAPRTVRRWVSGETDNIAKFNAELLAEILETDIKNLVKRDNSKWVAGQQDQVLAAELISKYDLHKVLAPSEKFDLAESLIRTSFNENLSLQELGVLYIQLAKAIRDQYTFHKRGSESKENMYERVKDCALQAIDIAQQLGDTDLEAEARSHLMVYYQGIHEYDKLFEQSHIGLSYKNISDESRADLMRAEAIARWAQAQHDTALSLFEKVHELNRHAKDEYATFKALAAHMACLCDAGLFSQAIDRIRELRESGLPFPQSISLSIDDSLYMAITMTSSMKDWPEEWERVRASVEAEARDMPYAMVSYARFCRLHGDPEEALQYADRAVQAFENRLQFSRVDAMQEKARALKKLNRIDEANQEWEKALAMFEKMNIPRRIRDTIHEFGDWH